MSDRKTIYLIFLITLAISFMLTLCLSASVNSYSFQLITKVVFITLILNMVVIYFSLDYIITLIKNKKSVEKNKKKTVRDYYQYKQLLNPPEIDN